MWPTKGHILFRHAELLEAVVFSDVHAFHVHYDFLANAVFEVEVVGVDGHGYGSRAVLDDEVLEDVAGFVGRSHPAVDDVGLVVGHAIFDTDCVDSLYVVRPIHLFEFGDGHVGSERRYGRVYHSIVEIVLTADEGHCQGRGRREGEDI